MSAERGPLAALPLVCERAGIPYGYTLTIWSAGALCIRRFGLPGLAEVFLFALGGTAGYAALALPARRKRRDGQPKPAAHDLVPGPLWENAVVLPALALTAAIAQLVPGAWLNFLVVPFVATAAYLGGLAVLVSLRAPPRGARPGTPPPMSSHRRQAAPLAASRQAASGAARNPAVAGPPGRPCRRSRRGA